jgi:hypothetical protein
MFLTKEAKEDLKQLFQERLKITARSIQMRSMQIITNSIAIAGSSLLAIPVKHPVLIVGSSIKVPFGYTMNASQYGYSDSTKSGNGVVSNQCVYSSFSPVIANQVCVSNSTGAACVFTIDIIYYEVID